LRIKKHRVKKQKKQKKQNRTPNSPCSLQALPQERFSPLALNVSGDTARQFDQGRSPIHVSDATKRPTSQCAPVLMKVRDRLMTHLQYQLM
jgi:hypothetical protein